MKIPKKRWKDLIFHPSKKEYFSGFTVWTEKSMFHHFPLSYITNYLPHCQPPWLSPWPAAQVHNTHNGHAHTRRGNTEFIFHIAESKATRGITPGPPSPHQVILWYYDEESPSPWTPLFFFRLQSGALCPCRPVSRLNKRLPLWWPQLGETWPPPKGCSTLLYLPPD